MVEIDGADDQTALRDANALIADSSAIDSVVHPAGPAATRLWQIRADGAGLAGQTAAGAPAWPGWEDSAVPPEHLGDYLRALQALMDRYERSEERRVGKESRSRGAAGAQGRKGQG